MKIENISEVSDVIFILGGSILAPVEKAYELYKAGYTPKIAFISTGGSFGGEKIWGMPENEKYREIIEKLSVSPDDIISERLTKNTLIEATQAIPFLERNGIQPEKVILISRPIHQCRAFATFEQQYPEVAYINCPANETLDFNDKDTLERLVGEAERLLDYFKKGDIKNQEIPFRILRAAAIIRMELKGQGTYSSRKEPTKC